MLQMHSKFCALSEESHAEAWSTRHVTGEHWAVSLNCGQVANNGCKAELHKEHDPTQVQFVEEIRKGIYEV